MNDIEKIQTQHRRNIVEAWGIRPGERVLEIACGQGDTTAALAEAVGEQGYVVGIDIGSADYGAPLTLGLATSLLKASALGDRMEFHLGFDLVADPDAFPPASFDVVAMAHGSWYFDSVARFGETLSVARTLAKRLCFAEWDLAVRHAEQIPHFLAARIRGEIEAYNPDSLANIRNPFYRDAIREMIHTSGWSVVGESEIDSRALQDGRWEVRDCLDHAMRDAEALNLPPQTFEEVAELVSMLETVADPWPPSSLDTFTMAALPSPT